MNDLALWLKALHIVAIVAWMAALLYMPRLFVYHSQVATGTEASNTFKIMERRLLKAIITPAMIASWVFGLILSLEVVDWAYAGWFHAKLVLVVAMSGFTGLLSKWTREFAQDRNTHSQRFYRIANEVPTLLMIAIVILTVVKPF